MQEIENKISRLTNFGQENLPNLGKWFVEYLLRSNVIVRS
ncbi:hypothetical protein NIES21_19470 [Anabaenopsis circularis NIES-21]|uniref:Uncharacterized protein n=1 Tax=Anabaenopsis circularis NIES-21 TaxID=1085406 RepID=A0A1Z4GF48_9CYAN|nr:hypothetical protein NIES21_19470 [Anabaenopsis circularis NIES-21]